MNLLGEGDENGSDGKITTKTAISFHVVVMLFTLGVWIVRLGDVVEQLQKEKIEDRKVVGLCVKKNSSSEQRIYRLEEHCGLKHPRIEEDGE